MEITVNNKQEQLSAEGPVTVASLLDMKDIRHNGTAVSVNNHIVCHDCWNSHEIKDGDRIVIISAAFGG